MNLTYDSITITSLPFPTTPAELINDLFNQVSSPVSVLPSARDRCPVTSPVSPCRASVDITKFDTPLVVSLSMTRQP